jgi:nitrogen fixation protein
MDARGTEFAGKDYGWRVFLPSVPEATALPNCLLVCGGGV